LGGRGILPGNLSAFHIVIVLSTLAEAKNESSGDHDRSSTSTKYKIYIYIYFDEIQS